MLWDWAAINSLSVLWLDVVVVYDVICYGRVFLKSGIFLDIDDYISTIIVIFANKYKF